MAVYGRYRVVEFDGFVEKVDGFTAMIERADTGVPVAKFCESPDAHAFAAAAAGAEARLLEEIDENDARRPAVAGGQGRDDEEIAETGDALLKGVLWVVGVAAAAGLCVVAEHAWAAWKASGK